MNYIKIDLPRPTRDPVELVSVDEFTEANWDGDGAVSVVDATIERAQDFLCSLPFNFPLGNAMAGIDGSLGVYWTRAAAELYVDFRPDGRTRYFYRNGDGVSLERVLPAGHTKDDVVEAIGLALPWFETATVRGTVSFQSPDSYSMAGEIQTWASSFFPAAPNHALEFFPDQMASQYLQAA